MLPIFSSLLNLFTPSKSIPSALQQYSKALLIGLMICVLLVLWKDMIVDSVHAMSLPSLPRKNIFAKPQPTTDAIANSTLGFQQVYALLLPDREDRKKPLVDAAVASNISLTILDAVKDADIPQTKIPKTWGKGNHKPKTGELGCLRSHVATWEKIIQENITSALIMESDADWDIRIHDILQGVAEGAKVIADWPFFPPGHNRDFYAEVSPYGDNWDVLWIGHCGSHLDGGGRAYAFNDTTVPPKEREFTFAGKPNREQHPEGTRLVFEFRSTVCTSAYAISNKGARKLRKFLDESNLNIDIRMELLCRDQPSLTCLGVWPQVITAAPSQSNIDHPAGERAPGTDKTGGPNEITVGPSLQISARRNAHIVQQGLGPDAWIKEWP